MRLLVPLDGSHLAERAIAPAALLARQAPSDTTITLLWVDEHEQIVQAVTEEFSSAVANSIPDRAEAHITYLEQVRQTAPLADMDVTVAVVPGEPATAIGAYARGMQADLIVMASHILTTLDRVLWGSVTEQVARESGIPTLIIRPQGSAFPDVSQAQPFTILVPLDGTEFSESALDAAAIVAQACSGKLLLMRVLPEMVASPNGLKEREAAAVTYLADIGQLLAGKGIKTDQLVVEGDPIIQITNALQAKRADVIAIATHGRGNAGKFGHASITMEVLHHMAAPMLVVHPTRSTSLLLAQ